MDRMRDAKKGHLPTIGEICAFGRIVEDLEIQVTREKSEPAARQLAKLLAENPEMTSHLEKFYAESFFDRPKNAPPKKILFEPLEYLRREIPVKKAGIHPPVSSPLHPNPTGIPPLDTKPPVQKRQALSHPKSPSLTAAEQSKLVGILGNLRERLNRLEESEFHPYENRLQQTRSAKTELEYAQRFKSATARTNSPILPERAGANRSKHFTACLVGYKASTLSLHQSINSAIDKPTEATVNFLSDAVDKLEVDVRSLVTQWKRGASLPRSKFEPCGLVLQKMQGEEWKDWEARLTQAAKNKRVWFVPICVLLVTGCRPACLSSEIRESLGVAAPVRTRRVGVDLLEFQIYGSKQENETVAGPPGVGYRWITVRNDAPWTDAIYSLTPSDGTFEVQTMGALNQLGEVIAELGLRLFGPSPRLSARLLRHRFATCCRRWGLTPTQQAMAMGHATMATMEKYGVSQDDFANLSLLGRVVDVRAERIPGAQGMLAGQR